MKPRTQLSALIEEVIINDASQLDFIEELPNLTEDYKKLNEKCENVISKIKTRKKTSTKSK